jgi:hypothetical protein
MGNGRLDDLRDILFVHPEQFDRGRSAEVAVAVALANERLARERRPYLLMGPGRWGSFDPWIGIPVVWHQISWARVIVECPAKDLPTEPSQGTHFFHSIGYFSLGSGGEQDYVRWELLMALPSEELAPGVRLVRLATPLSVRMDGQTQQGAIVLP